MDYPSTITNNDPIFSQSTTEQEALKGNFTKNQLSDLYFSRKNIDALQEGIRYQVYVRTNNTHIINRQSDTELAVVMRSVYYEHSRNLPFDIIGQVKQLNAKVLEYCVNDIISEIRMRLHYQKDIDAVPMPLPQPLSMSSAGSKTLMMKDF